MRMELGGMCIVFEPAEVEAGLPGTLLRHLSNQEVADMLGITERTVRRWKEEGRLPNRGGGRMMLLELLRHLGGDSADPQETRGKAVPSAGVATENS